MFQTDAEKILQCASHVKALPDRLVVLETATDLVDEYLTTRDDTDSLRRDLAIEHVSLLLRQFVEERFGMPKATRSRKAAAKPSSKRQAVRRASPGTAAA